MASFRCYDNSDVIATLIMTNFHLYLIQLWWQFFQMFVYGDVVYAQTWQVLTLKNCIEPLSYASTAYVVAWQQHALLQSALVSFRLFCKNLGNLQEFVGQMDHRPPWQKVARTPMPMAEDVSAFSQQRKFLPHARETSGTQGIAHCLLLTFLCRVTCG